MNNSEGWLNFSSPYPYNLSNINTEEDSNDVLLLNKRENDKKLIEFFLNECTVTSKAKTKNKDASRISEVKSLLNDIHECKNKLSSLVTDLSSDNLSEDEWKEKSSECEDLKIFLQSYLQNLKSETFLKTLHKIIKKQNNRKNKRCMAKKRWSTVKSLINIKRKKLNMKANTWMTEKQDIINKEKEEKHLRKNADIVLEDVKLKRNDTKKYLTLLQQLESLRKIKINIIKARGEVTSVEAESVFTNVIEKLRKPWQLLDREYSLEEQGLKLMIKTDMEENVSRVNKSMFEDWKSALFTKKKPTKSFYDNDEYTFKAIRNSWDKYLDFHSGTEIPVGWILPCRASSAAWSKHL